MGLINLYTDLKSLKFGKDRIGGGSSNQPYIKTPIPEKIGEFGYLNQDFILRGGSKAVTDSALDVVRLGKYFTDLRNPSGLLFVAKQNLLSRMAVRTQSSTGILNEGIYTPISTLLQAGGVAFGLHTNKQGLNPFNGNGGIKTYSEEIYSNQADNDNAYRLNRLYQLYDVKIQNNPNIYVDNSISLLNDDILTYKGGPGSVLGIGSTNIKFADQRTGLNNPKYGKDFSYQSLGYRKSTQIINNIYYPIGASEQYLGPGLFTVFQLVSSPSSRSINSTGMNWYYDSAGKEPKRFGIGGLLNGYQKPLSSQRGPIGSVTGIYTGDNATYTKDDILNLFREDTYTTSQIVTDFRVKLRGRINENLALAGGGTNPYNILSSAPDYSDSGPNAKNIETRVKLGDPGYRNGKNLKSYTDGANPGKISGKSGGNASEKSYDKINASYIYQSENGAFGKNNDLVKFAIGVIDNDNPSKKNYLHFRAFLNQISDGYSADWSATKYIGRGENFYTYNGFDRKVSLSWTVAAQSKAELIPMYKKLNYLASVITPDYSPNGYMRGNMVTLTIGGYFYEQPGIINGFSYEMNDDDSSWEIGINDIGTSDHTVKELPHMIKVTGFSFTPIHTFVPRKQNIVGLGGNGIDENGNLIDPNKYGPERYIALTQGNEDWNNYGSSTEAIWATPSVPKKESVPVQSTPTTTFAPAAVAAPKPIIPIKPLQPLNVGNFNNGNTGVTNTSTLKEADKIALLIKQGKIK